MYVPFTFSIMDLMLRKHVKFEQILTKNRPHIGQVCHAKKLFFSKISYRAVIRFTLSQIPRMGRFEILKFCKKCYTLLIIWNNLNNSHWNRFFFTQFIDNLMILTEFYQINAIEKYIFEKCNLNRAINSETAGYSLEVEFWLLWA